MAATSASNNAPPETVAPEDVASEFVVPEGFRLHTENTAKILLPAEVDAFLNPVQEFNRDLSVAAIRTFSEELAREKEARFWAAQERKKTKKAKRAKVEGFHPPKIVILEALSATGLRSIRYAQEIPLVNHVIANDLSEHAVEAMKRNIELNGLGQKPGEVCVAGEASAALMYAHATEKSRVDVVDLDPYGSAAPFIDAAVQSVTDGGLLCVTCTDLSVLATNNYPEKCYANYGGVPAKAEYCHEIALRLVLHTISQAASRYGRYIEPVLSLSIDFYIRLFVTVKTAPIHVKRAVVNTSTVYVCSFCQAHYDQPLGKAVEKKNDRTGQVTHLFKTQSGPPVADKCPECHSTLHVAGPIWNARIHNPKFVDKMLKHLEANEGKYGTAARMKGMLTVAQEVSQFCCCAKELDTQFYFTPPTIASHFHSVCPSLAEMASALLNADHKISRSHACAGSLKTTASRREIHDIFRSWVKQNPVKTEKIPEASPTRVLLAKEATCEADFAKHPNSPLPGWKVKLVRYQPNPAPNWGPGTKAPSGTKRKRENEDE
ncbi:N2,N2-dimethylguanosine tRNA methyltransferase-domain-containing protein [Vararia minispora EC-137]|uniref:N2,N2-dimethylguanosine tRNA methyltransferase-domain-containing protein n=1 Tax=Vararia minispora EC-137 TaxID=1314806 RepID=A0ACB8QTS4_9AGAM|nr:N2,N2-dimethylguanosine tRNA methyltransferase-domain-containing protein [Vararia minispora EC-137]